MSAVTQQDPSCTGSDFSDFTSQLYDMIAEASRALGVTPSRIRRPSNARPGLVAIACSDCVEITVSAPEAEGTETFDIRVEVILPPGFVGFRFDHGAITWKECVASVRLLRPLIDGYRKDWPELTGDAS